MKRLFFSATFLVATCFVSFANSNQGLMNKDLSKLTPITEDKCCVTVTYQNGNQTISATACDPECCEKAAIKADQMIMCTAE